MSFVKILLKQNELTTNEIKTNKQPSNINCCVNL